MAVRLKRLISLGSTSLPHKAGLYDIMWYILVMVSGLHIIRLEIELIMSLEIEMVC